MLEIDARVQNGARSRIHAHTVWVIDPGTGHMRVGPETADVRIFPEAIFDCSDVIGKPFEDHNGNGYQNDPRAGRDGSITDQIYHDDGMGAKGGKPDVAPQPESSVDRGIPGARRVAPDGTVVITADRAVFGGEIEVEASARVTLTLDRERFETDAGEGATELGTRMAYAVYDLCTVTAGTTYFDQVIPGEPDETCSRLNTGLKRACSPNNDLALPHLRSAHDGPQRRPRRRPPRGGGRRGAAHRKAARAAKCPPAPRATWPMRISPGRRHPSARPASATRSTRPATAPTALSTTTAGSSPAGAPGSPKASASTCESAFVLPGEHQSQTNTHGVSYTPDAAWTQSGSFDYGEVRDEESGDFEPLATSAVPPAHAAIRSQSAPGSNTAPKTATAPRKAATPGCLPPATRPC